MGDFDRNDTSTRLDALDREGFVIVVTKAFGPNGEDLMDQSGPHFSGEAGVKLLVQQGDLKGEVLLSPYYGDSSKITDVEFVEGKPCELFVAATGAPLDRIPGMKTPDGGDFFAIYLTSKLKEGEMVAINNIWGDSQSQMMSEGELLERLAELDDSAS